MQAANDNVPTDATPLRLEAALAYAFPFGGMTVSGLRREALRGRLAIERIAGKDFTTLSAIEDMRRLCRVSAGGHTSTSNQKGVPPTVRLKSAHIGSSETESPNIAQEAFLEIVRQQRGR